MESVVSLLALAAFAGFMVWFAASVLEGTALRRYFLLESTLYAIFAGLFLLTPLLKVRVPFTVCVAVFVLFKLLLFICCCVGSGSDVRWSANKGAVLAFITWAALLPHILQSPIDGDEPYYLLATESLMADGDMDLSNQYRRLDLSRTGRLDLRPQPGDPTGRRGEQLSRHEPFLPLLLVPGRVLGGLPGAVLTITLFGALLVRSTLRLLEEEGISQRTSLVVFFLFAFGPPVLFFATRIWPEVPAAFFFVESIRAIRQRRNSRLALSLLGLVLLKIRFVLLAAPLLLLAIRKSRMSPRTALLTLAVLPLPLAIAWLVTGNPLNVHATWELVPWVPVKMVRGLFGLLLDGAAGLLIQAPALFVAVFALGRWSSLPASVRIGLLASLPYLFFLLPRDEWHGGWSPPLRYIVFLSPLLIVSLASMLDRRRSIAPFVLPIVGTIVIALHGIAYPWRLFQMAGGENFVGEWLSIHNGSDYSRIFPSFIRLNEAAVLGSILFCVAFLLSTVRPLARIATSSPFTTSLFTLAVALMVSVAGSAGPVVHLEDAHVTHEGGALSPARFTVARFMHTGGWRMDVGSTASFRLPPGRANLFFTSDSGATIILDGSPIMVPATSGHWLVSEVLIDESGRHHLEVRNGSLVVDRIESHAGNPITRFVGRHR